MTQLSDTLEFFDSLVILLSNDHIILGINQVALDAYGWQRPDVLNKDFPNLLKQNKFKNPLPRSLPSGKSFSLKSELTVLKKKNNQTFIRWNVNSFVSNDDLLHKILLIGNDITWQKKLEEKVYELDSIIAQMPGNVYWHDIKFKYLGCNDNSAKTLGMPRDHTVGQDFKTLMRKIKDFPETSINKWVQDGLDVIRSRKPKLNILEVPFIGPDNQMMYAITNKVPLFNKAGKVSGVLGITTDITPQVKAEQTLKIAKEKAEAANKSKTEFLSNMSHDVKTPLSGMIAFAELLDLKVSPELSGLTKDLLNAGNRLMVFFENIIELSKFENHSTRLTKENFNIKELLKEIVQLFKPTIVAKGLSLHVDYSKKISQWFFGARILFYRIILNLLGNAVKFTNKGSIYIRVGLSRKSTAKKSIIDLTIADTGIGISDEMQKSIFEKFSRVAPSYQGTYEGHGIGLYIVKEFVKSMHGKIHLKSKLGEGSEFTISVPLQTLSISNVEVEIEQIRPENIFTQPGAAGPKNHNSYKIKTPSTISQSKVLFVEDNKMAQFTGKSLFNFLGYMVDIADCGEKAINLFNPGKYLLVFIDIGLPDIKGYEVAKRFRTMERGTKFHVPILGLSAHASQEEKKLSSDAGIEEMLSKPLLLDQAKMILQRYVNSLNMPSETILQNSQSVTLSDTGESGLKIISLEKPTDSLDSSRQSAWGVIAVLVSSLPEVRADIELSYKEGDLEKLANKVHKLHGGLCYTNTPDLLQATRALEICLKKGEHDKLAILYENFIKAMDTFEELYRSVQKHTNN